METPGQPDLPRRTARNVGLPECIVGLHALLMQATQGVFTLADDEIAILCVARVGPVALLSRFFAGGGLHEHPPLSDVLLATWLSATDNLSWVRVPSTLAFSLAILVAVRTARLLGGARAATWVAVLAATSAYGFHFGRQAGWYGFAALGVALLFHLLARFQQRPSPASLGALALGAATLLWTNYFGWVLVGLLLLVLIRWNATGKHVPWWWLAPSAGAVVVAFLPLAAAFVTVLRQAAGTPQGAVARAANLAFNVLVQFTSESVAPWTVPGVAAAPAVAVVLATVLRAAGRNPGHPAWLWLFSMACMAAVGSILAKRIVMLSPLAWLGWGLAAAQMTGKQRTIHAAGALTLGALAWMGVLHGGYYAAFRFVEPWPRMAAEAVHAARNGTTIYTNGQVLGFYLAAQAQAARGQPGPPTVAAGCGGDVHPDQLPIHVAGGGTFPAEAPPAGRLRIIVGQSEPGPAAELDAVLRAARARCTPLEVDRQLEDKGVAFKAALFPAARQRAWRVEVLEFQCP